jgi:hypothetical protein
MRMALFVILERELKAFHPDPIRFLKWLEVSPVRVQDGSSLITLHLYSIHGLLKPMMTQSLLYSEPMIHILA